MTGYAQARAEQNGWTVQLSLRSVNHRFFDVRIRIPEGFDTIEQQIRQMTRDRVHRGHLDVTLQVELAKRNVVKVNRDVAAAYLETARSLAQEFGVKAEPDLAGILRLPGVTSESQFSESDGEDLGELICSCLAEALERLDAMRQLEGRALGEELSRCLERISELAGQIESLAERERPAAARRLERRLKQFLAEIPVDPVRLAQEAAFLAERSDATEELARLRSHVQQFQALLAGAGAVGKKLDFLLQEMQREANTLLSKSSGVGAEGLEITQLGLEVKSEIEKLREQVQNVE